MSKLHCRSCGHAQSDKTAVPIIIGGGAMRHAMRCDDCGKSCLTEWWTKGKPEETHEDNDADNNNDDDDDEEESFEEVLEGMSYSELKVLAKEAKIPNYYRTGREDLIKLLQESSDE